MILLNQEGALEMSVKEKTGISREEALNLLTSYIKNPNMINHCLASEAVMRAIASKMNQDQDIWGIAGLLHDIDVELTEGNLEEHTLKGAEILKANGVSDEIIEAVKAHNETAYKKERTDPFHIALAAGETITGLITATTLVYPDKKIKSVKPKSIVKRMKEKAFAASVNRETIRECEKLNIPLNEFAIICLEAMTSIDEQLGL